MKNSAFATSLSAKESKIPETTLGIRNGPTPAIIDSGGSEYANVATPMTRNGKSKFAKAIVKIPVLPNLGLSLLRIVFVSWRIYRDIDAACTIRIAKTN